MHHLNLFTQTASNCYAP